MAELENGQVVKGETNIDIPRHDGRLRVKRVWLEPDAQLNSRAREALLRADLVIIGPGDVYTSIVPNLLVKGMAETLRKTKAKVAYFVNLMTKFGETSNFAASDFVHTMQSYLGDGVLDFAVINNKKPSPERLRNYVKENSEFVVPDLENIKAAAHFVPVAADLVRPKGFIRHDPEKIARVIKMIL
jgi:uncharacterized cofD-like protein